MDKYRLCSRIRSLAYPLTPISSDHPTKLAKLRGVRCVAFDFYGTMFISGVGDIGIDDEQEQSQSVAFFNEALKASDFSIKKQTTGEKGLLTFQEILEKHISSAQKSGIEYPEPDIFSVWEEVLTELHNQSLIVGDIDEQHVAQFCIEFEFRINPVWPAPRLRKVLSKLLKEKYILGIISNSQFYTPITFNAFMEKSPAEFGFHPELLIWSYKVGCKKPSEAFYQTFTNALTKNTSLAPDQVLYVGNDIRKDISPAKKLGMRTALYVGDQRSIRHEPSQLEEAKFTPDIIIGDLYQLINCLQA